MRTYLRFTPREFGALSRACRSIPLRDDCFASFQPSLVGSLAAVLPDLARRIAAFRSYQVGILFEHLKERRGRVEAGPELTAAECEAVARACGSAVPHRRFVCCFRDTLAHHFRDASPELADKLARLSGPQLERLYEQVRQHRGRGA